MPKKDRDILKAVNSRSVFIDSSAWIALFSRRDQHHEETDCLFRILVSSRQRILTTNLVLAEIHRLLLHRAGISAAAAALEKIEASSLVEIIFADNANHASAKGWMNKLKQHPISYTDAISFSVMEASGCSRAMSYDHHFRTAGFDFFTGASE